MQKETRSKYPMWAQLQPLVQMARTIRKQANKHLCTMCGLKRFYHKLLLAIIMWRCAALCQIALQSRCIWDADNGKQPWRYEIEFVNFCKLNFFDKGKHGSYSTKPNTVCAILIKLGNISAVEADHKWWDTTRSTVMRMHTDHRNNCVKAMRLRFRGTCWCRDKGKVCAMCLANQNDLPKGLAWMQNLIFQIAMQTMRITKHCTEG